MFLYGYGRNFRVLVYYGIVSQKYKNNSFFFHRNHKVFFYHLVFTLFAIVIDSYTPVCLASTMALLPPGKRLQNISYNREQGKYILKLGIEITI